MKYEEGFCVLLGVIWICISIFGNGSGEVPLIISQMFMAASLIISAKAKGE